MLIAIIAAGLVLGIVRALVMRRRTVTTTTKALGNLMNVRPSDAPRFPVVPPMGRRIR